MTKPATVEDKIRIEEEIPWHERDKPATLFEFLNGTCDKFGDQPALSFQLLSDPKAPAETLTWNELRAKVVQAANMFRSLGIGERDKVAFLLPNTNETVFTLLGGAVAGIVSPINPLLDPKQIAAILRTSGAKVLVTLRSFPRTNIAQLAAEAVSEAPNVETILEIDLNRYLSPPKSWIVPFLRPKSRFSHSARILDFNKLLASQNDRDLDFEDSREDRTATLFHTGGTTGIPKLAQHRNSGIFYNGWCGKTAVIDESETVICPLPLFHVFAAYPVLMTCMATGSHVVFPTPAGYRGDGVFENFWKLVERWKITSMITVPRAVAELMQRPPDADVSTLNMALCGSAPLPKELFHRFERATGVRILEGYGLTEVTCLVSLNPFAGERKIGSVGIPFPYTDVRILECDADGTILKECGRDEVGEICVSNPGVIPGGTYVDPDKNKGLFADGSWLRTGDLGKLDEDGYLWITGRAKDMIIRGGHNVDPAIIEEALAGHESVAFVGAIGQPDAVQGEVPCAYTELVAGANTSSAELHEFARAKIRDKLAMPEYVEVVDELPKTAVMKVFKPDLRKLAIRRIYNERLEAEGLDARVSKVIEDPKRGLVAQVTGTTEASEKPVGSVLGEYATPWERAD